MRTIIPPWPKRRLSLGSETAPLELAWGRVSGSPRLVWLPRLLLKPLGPSTWCSVVSDPAIPPAVAHQAPLSMAFFRQEYCSGLPFPPPGDLPSPGIEPASPVSPALQADSLPAESSGKPLGWSRPIPTASHSRLQVACPLLSHLSISIVLRSKHHTPVFR